MSLPLLLSAFPGKGETPHVFPEVSTRFAAAHTAGRPHRPGRHQGSILKWGRGEPPGCSGPCGAQPCRLPGRGLVFCPSGVRSSQVAGSPVCPGSLRTTQVHGRATCVTTLHGPVRRSVPLRGGCLRQRLGSTPCAPAVTRPGPSRS